MSLQLRALPLRTLFLSGLAMHGGGLLAARDISPFNDGWSFIRHDVTPGAALTAKDAVPVTLPHTWNATDLQSVGDKGAYIGAAVYRKTFRADEALRDKRVFLRFEGVGSVAEVFFNGEKIGEHRGSYSAFCYEITDRLKRGADNTVVVRVNNAARPDVLPVNQALFAIFGGIYRPASLIVTDKVCIVPTDHASPGVYLDQDKVTAESASLCVRAKLSNARNRFEKVVVTAELLDASGSVVGVSKVEKTLPYQAVTEVRIPMVVTKPHLWNGSDDPYLHTLRVTVREASGAGLDRVDQSVGLRSAYVDPEKGFLLNGSPLKLHGVCRHQDADGKGNALTDEDHRRDFGFIREIGANSIRLAHYQQSDVMYTEADKSGVLVWAEIPFVNACTGKEAENARTQLVEMIRQNYNHPSIFVWGLHNEVYGKADGDAVTLTKDLHDLAKSEDPYRQDVAVSGFGSLDDKPMNYNSDLQGINRYFGWYEGRTERITDWLASLPVKRPGTLFSLSEYGAEAAPGVDSEFLIRKFNPVQGEFWPENYQRHLHEVYWAAIAKSPNIWSSYVWNLFDFTVPPAATRAVKYRNTKGLVTYDRKTRKDAFYYYKAAWSKEPVLHITGKLLPVRTLPEFELAVYSNVGDTSLELDGVAAPAPKQGGVPSHLIWRIVPKPGKNTVRVKGVRDGRTFTDEYTFTFDPKAKPALPDYILKDPAKYLDPAAGAASGDWAGFVDGEDSLKKTK